MPSLTVSLLLAFVVWVVVRRLRRPRSPLADVPGPESDHWLKGTLVTFGNYGRIFQDGWDYNLQLQEKYGGVVKVHALLGVRDAHKQLYVSDPRALHYIVVKEQHIYTETDMFIMGNKLIFGDGLISTLGAQHKKQRKMLNPVFSLANMRDLLPVIQPIADSLASILLAQRRAGPREINVLPWMSRGALEYICQAALGYSFNALDPRRTNAYAEAIQKLAPSALRLIFIRPFVPLFLRTRFPLKAFQDLRGVVRAMDEASRRIFREKKARLAGVGQVKGAEAEEGEKDLGDRMRGRDIMSIMLNANMSSEESERLSDEELLGQMSTIIFAGFETTSTAISRILFILASRPDVQRKLRSEIRAAKRASGNHTEGTRWEDVGLGYDELMAVPYLDAVVRETLRVYPPTSLLARTCRQDTTLPLAHPPPARPELAAIPVPAGTNVIMSLLCANHNKAVWGADADEWRPGRWLTEKGERVPLSDVQEESESGERYPGVYASMMTFLGGGRACIGFKFAEMEIKQVLATLLSRMAFALPSQPGKTVRWKMNGLQVPVVEPPFGDGATAQVPLEVRRVAAGDFLD
ncbi:cytochrome P450 [Gloeophyllum trabeum ATCC 11539]|uniref:Cytochrome P450 n=1 Tax=Gloeophyllum trabeum (strain ATCC 11539 / FP-39264 / Madison 617) TaxID=670483 RepID=S7QDW5_GLOTA|nr:cytochrome P450 [Gloeophyllum trabeum ATCC 11539]EPQ57612.1 cytochrome P450 [Gloeophyllum trabeum ATCC 11539]